jgi:hypothetical protein
LCVLRATEPELLARGTTNGLAWESHGPLGTYILDLTLAVGSKSEHQLQSKGHLPSKPQARRGPSPSSRAGTAVTVRAVTHPLLWFRPARSGHRVRLGPPTSSACQVGESTCSGQGLKGRAQRTQCSSGHQKQCARHGRHGAAGRRVAASTGSHRRFHRAAHPRVARGNHVSALRVRPSVYARLPWLWHTDQPSGRGPTAPGRRWRSLRRAGCLSRPLLPRASSASGSPVHAGSPTGLLWCSRNYFCLARPSSTTRRSGTRWRRFTACRASDASRKPRRGNGARRPSHAKSTRSCRSYRASGCATCSVASLGSDSRRRRAARGTAIQPSRGEGRLRRRQGRVLTFSSRYVAKARSHRHGGVAFRLR